MFGSIIGSYVAQNWSYEYSFYLSTFLSALGGIATLPHLRKKDERKHSHEISLTKSFRIGLRNLTYSGSLRTLLIIAMMSFMARSVIWTFLPLYASVVVGMSTLEVGLLSAVISLTGLLASIIIGKFSNLIKKNIFVASGFFIASILMVSYNFIETTPLTYLVSIGVSIALSASPLMIAMLSEASPKEHVGMSMGIFGSFEDLGVMIGPAIYGLVWTSFQPGYIFVVSGIVQMLSAFLALTLRTKDKT
jgi:predicted MFS family arabinose efflux permease